MQWCVMMAQNGSGGAACLISCTGTASTSLISWGDSKVGGKVYSYTHSQNAVMRTLGRVPINLLCNVPVEVACPEASRFLI